MPVISYCSPRLFGCCSALLLLSIGLAACATGGTANMQDEEVPEQMMESSTSDRPNGESSDPPVDETPANFDSDLQDPLLNVGEGELSPGEAVRTDSVTTIQELEAGTNTVAIPEPEQSSEAPASLRGTAASAEPITGKALENYNRWSGWVSLETCANDEQRIRKIKDYVIELWMGYKNNLDGSYPELRDENIRYILTDWSDSRFDEETQFMQQLMEGEENLRHEFEDLTRLTEKRNEMVARIDSLEGVSRTLEREIRSCEKKKTALNDWEKQNDSNFEFRLARIPYSVCMIGSVDFPSFGNDDVITARSALYNKMLFKAVESVKGKDVGMRLMRSDAGSLAEELEAETSGVAQVADTYHEDIRDQSLINEKANRLNYAIQRIDVFPFQEGQMEHADNLHVGVDDDNYVLEFYVLSEEQGEYILTNMKTGTRHPVSDFTKLYSQKYLDYMATILAAEQRSSRIVEKRTDEFTKKYNSRKNRIDAERTQNEQRLKNSVEHRDAVHEYIKTTNQKTKELLVDIAQTKERLDKAYKEYESIHSSRQSWYNRLNSRDENDERADILALVEDCYGVCGEIQKKRTYSKIRVSVHSGLGSDGEIQTRTEEMDFYRNIDKFRVLSYHQKPTENGLRHFLNLAFQVSFSSAKSFDLNEKNGTFIQYGPETREWRLQSSLIDVLPFQISSDSVDEGWIIPTKEDLQGLAMDLLVFEDERGEDPLAVLGWSSTDFYLAQQSSDDRENGVYPVVGIGDGIADEVSSTTSVSVLTFREVLTPQVEY